MVYDCVICKFTSNLKGNYKRHLITTKHIKNINKHGVENIDIQKEPYNSLQNPPKLEGIPSKTLQNPPKNIEIFTCNYCSKMFSRKDNMVRHMEERCKKNNNVNYKDLFYKAKEEFENEKNELKKHIELLLTKVGNTTTINNTNNIQLNNYGKEDLSHITDNLKIQLLDIPYGAIPKMIEEVHFNDNKPENKNIALTNKKDNKLKVFSNNKWNYRNKDEILHDLIDGKYFILDSYYEDNVNKLDKKYKNYDNFRKCYDNNDKKLLEQLKNDSELILLNNR
jgi:hypothetical protein